MRKHTNFTGFWAFGFWELTILVGFIVRIVMMLVSSRMYFSQCNPEYNWQKSNEFSSFDWSDKLSVIDRFCGAVYYYQSN